MPVPGALGDESELPAFLPGLGLADPGSACDVAILAVLVVSLRCEAITPEEAEVVVLQAAELGGYAVFQPPPGSSTDPPHLGDTDLVRRRGW